MSTTDNTDTLGRSNPGAETIRRHNAQKSPDPGYDLWLGRAHIRQDHRAAWNALTAKERGRIIAAALDIAIASATKEPTT